MKLLIIKVTVVKFVIFLHGNKLNVGYYIQEKAALKSELSRAKADLQAKTKDYMREVKSLKEKLQQYEIERM